MTLPGPMNQRPPQSASIAGAEHRGGWDMRKLLLLMLLAPCLSGCGFLIGRVAREVEERRDRAGFIAEFHRQNQEREKAGLPLLDFCAEMYRTAPRWYHWDDSCKKVPPLPPAKA